MSQGIDLKVSLYSRKRRENRVDGNVHKMAEDALIAACPKNHILKLNMP
jgi:hypothetical protein